MRRSLFAFAATAAIASRSSSCCQAVLLQSSAILRSSTTRVLEGDDGSSYQYMNDVSGYHMQFGKCVRVKIPQNNDDDAEGNSYFVNGRYHAFYQNYASFYLCENDDGCGSCDYSVEYVTDLDTYLEASTNYLQGMCNACSANCRRQLEDEQDNDGGNYNYANLDCSTCQSQCQNLNDDGGAADETQYLECQAGPQGDDGLQYYSAPQCGSTSNIIIGLYYDEDCFVKTSQELDYGFTYDTFNLVTSACVDCQDGLCANLYANARHCSEGYNHNQNYADDNDNGDMPVCRTYKSMEDKTYSQRSKKVPYMPLIIVIVVLSVFALFGAYTYYVRHKNPLAEPLSGSGGGHTDLPPIT